MVPDIEAYAPHIDAVFGRLERDDPRYLPYTLSDRSAGAASPLANAVEALLHLPQWRFTAADILDLLDVPALRRRFGIPESALPQLSRWIEQANIRWGLHERQRASLDLPGFEQNSWAFGLRRMLAGYLIGDGPAWRGIEPWTRWPAWAPNWPAAWRGCWTPWTTTGGRSGSRRRQLSGGSASAPCWTTCSNRRRPTTRPWTPACATPSTTGWRPASRRISIPRCRSPWPAARCSTPSTRKAWRNASWPGASTSAP